MSATSAAPALDLAHATGLRLLPVPVCEPPYDDELVPGLSAVQPGPLRRSPVGPLHALPPLRLLPPLPDHDEDDDDGPASRTPLSELPPVRPAAHAVVQGLLEVLAGVRGLAQLKRATSLELYEQLEAHLSTRPRGTGARPRTGAVRSLHVQERPEGVAEVCATVAVGGRAAAYALRLEGVDGRWCCTELAGLT